MKIRSLVSSTLLAASLGLGINAPAQADHGIYSSRFYDRDDYCPVHLHDRHYGKHHKHRYLKNYWSRHDWRRHDDRGRRHHDNDDRGRRHDDRGRDHARYDDHDGYRRD